MKISVILIRFTCTIFFRRWNQEATYDAAANFHWGTWGYVHGERGKSVVAGWKWSAATWNFDWKMVNWNMYRYNIGCANRLYVGPMSQIPCRYSDLMPTSARYCCASWKMSGLNAKWMMKSLTLIMVKMTLISGYLDPNKRVNSLTEDELTKVRDIIDKHYSVEGDLRRENSVNLKRLVDLGC